ncbi:3-hydroxyacyl-ACP dehydratase FabZ family protein [Actinosynnema sp. CS-041913]|uniref:3-hydroxyacyl-ACP dehydratase FabZ family protein n=1 Tax=Actinosynnema sp. CS-041913 TaxID=3239917 RepID=UPI003D8DFDB1
MTYAEPPAAADEVTASADGYRCVRTVRATDPYLVGHFPGNPVYPGVFTIETVYRAARRIAEEHGPPVALAKVKSARFTAPVTAGDTLTVDFTLRRHNGRLDVDARCHSGGRETARVKLELGQVLGGA